MILSKKLLMPAPVLGGTALVICKRMGTSGYFAEDTYPSIFDIETNTVTQGLTQFNFSTDIPVKGFFTKDGRNYYCICAKEASQPLTLRIVKIDITNAAGAITTLVASQTFPQLNNAGSYPKQFRDSSVVGAFEKSGVLYFRLFFGYAVTNGDGTTSYVMNFKYTLDSNTITLLDAVSTVGSTYPNVVLQAKGNY